MKRLSTFLFAVTVTFGVHCSFGDEPISNHAKTKAPQKTKALNVLFIGNSYTARHNLAQVVKQFAETADPELEFKPTQVIYGGRTLKDHWRLGTQYFVNRGQMKDTKQLDATIAELKAAVANKNDDKYAKAGLKKLQDLREQFQTGKLATDDWDWIVLQSYRDDLDGHKSLYMQYAPKFAALAKAQGAKVLLYETTPTTQNQSPITKSPDSAVVIAKAKSIASLAKQTGAVVAPMSYVALRCQTDNPEFTLRFENDAHLNQTMAYLTACTIHAAMFGSNPEGLAINSVTDIRFWENDRKTAKDRDAKPIKKVFSAEEQSSLQKTAWLALQDFKAAF